MDGSDKDSDEEWKAADNGDLHPRMLDAMLDSKKEAYGLKKNSPLRAVSPLAKPVFHKELLDSTIKPGLTDKVGSASV